MKAMAPRLVCSPPPGFVTVLKDSHQTRFTLAVAFCSELASDNSAGRDWEAVVWHNNTDGDNWAELPLERSSNHRPQGSVCFSGSLMKASDRVSRFRFTIKFRPGPHAPWQWAKERLGLEDGEVIFAPQKLPNDNLSHYIAHPDHEVSVESGPEKSGEACLSWELAIPAAAAQGRWSGYSTAGLGNPVRAIQWFAIVRHNEAWFGPRQGRRRFCLDKDGVLLSFLRDDGVHLVLFALSLDDVVITLGSDEEGNIVGRCRNDQPSAGTGRVFIAAATEPEVAIATVLQAAKNFIRFRTPKDNRALHVPVAEHDKRRLQDWQDGFAYCTWNGLGQHLTPEKIMDALGKLSAYGVHAPNLIIDDNWQSLELTGESNFQHRWTTFEANRENFPDGLKALTLAIRRQFPHIQNIAVWHGIFGYWGGMSATGHVGQTYRMRTVKRREGIWLGGGEVTTADGPSANSLFDDFYSFLVDSGVDAVKTDTQSFLDYPEHADDRCALTAPYQSAWRSAVAKHFDGRAIACMAQIPQNISEFLRGDGTKFMMRNSDDFFPDDPRSHTWHVFCNAHVALLSQHLNVLPDWDMFQTVHDFSRFHAVARCLSGGPIYITDRPGEHDSELIGEMTAKTPDGRLVILRPEVVGRTAEMYLQHFDRRLLRIQARHGQASMLGLFNMGLTALTEFVFLCDFLPVSDADASAKFIIHQHGSAKLAGPFALLVDDPISELTVAERGAEILTAHVVHEFGTTSLSVLGLLGKMSGAAAVVAVECCEQPSSSELRLRVCLKALGNLGIAHSPLPSCSRFLRPNPFAASGANGQVCNSLIMHQHCVKGVYIASPNLQLSRIGVAVHGSEVHDLHKHLGFSNQMLRLDLVGIWKSLGKYCCSREESEVEIVVTLPA